MKDIASRDTRALVRSVSKLWNRCKWSQMFHRQFCPFFKKDIGQNWNLCPTIIYLRTTFCSWAWIGELQAKSEKTSKWSSQMNLNIIKGSIQHRYFCADLSSCILANLYRSGFREQRSCYIYRPKGIKLDSICFYIDLHVAHAPTTQTTPSRPDNSSSKTPESMFFFGNPDNHLLYVFAFAERVDPISRCGLC